MIDVAKGFAVLANLEIPHVPMFRSVTISKSLEYVSLFQIVKESDVKMSPSVSKSSAGIILSTSAIFSCFHYCYCRLNFLTKDSIQIPFWIPVAVQNRQSPQLQIISH